MLMNAFCNGTYDTVLESATHPHQLVFYDPAAETMERFPPLTFTTHFPFFPFPHPFSFMSVGPKWC